jgi:hypothetical protein
MQAPASITSARFGCRPTISAPLSRRSGRAIERDLPVDLGEAEHRPLDNVGVVRRELVFHRSEVRGRAAHGDKPGRRRTAIQPPELGRELVEDAGKGFL